MNKNILKSVLIYTIIYISIFVIINFILNVFDMNYREWIYFVSLILIVIGLIVGTIQLLCKIKKKILKRSLIGLFIVTLIPCMLYILVFCLFAYKPEHVVIKDGQKMIAYVNGFMDTYVEYYEYKSFFTVGNKIKIKEYYGSGGFDPIENNSRYNHPIISTQYFDEDGKIINDVINDIDN